jgi:hypothetical protein
LTSKYGRFFTARGINIDVEDFLYGVEWSMDQSLRYFWLFSVEDKTGVPLIDGFIDKEFGGKVGIKNWN